MDTKYELMLKTKSGKRIEMLQELPSKGDQFPTLILVPGFGVDLHEYGLFDFLASYLNRNGYQTIRFSFLGTGRSEGDFVKMTLGSQVEQLNEIIAYTQVDRFTQTDKIALLAQSFGVVTTVAALPLDLVKSLMFLSTPAAPKESLEKYFRRKRGYCPASISSAKRADGHITRLGPQFWESINGFNSKNQLIKIYQPTLFLHGSKDITARAHLAHEWYECVSSRKKFVLLEGADHGFTKAARYPLAEQVVTWLDDTV